MFTKVSNFGIFRPRVELRSLPVTKTHVVIGVTRNEEIIHQKLAKFRKQKLTEQILNVMAISFRSNHDARDYNFSVLGNAISYTLG